MEMVLRRMKIEGATVAARSQNDGRSANLGGSDDVRELKSLAKKKGGAAKIAKALKRTTRAVENKSYLLGVSLDTRG
jgi:hypothetical protein